MQDRHVTYREIEKTVVLTEFRKRSKKALVDQCIEKYNGNASKDVSKIVTGDKSWIYAQEVETEQQTTKVTVNNTDDDRTSKRSEYGYANKCQTFQWRCQNATENTQCQLGHKYIKQLPYVYKSE